VYPGGFFFFFFTADYPVPSWNSQIQHKHLTRDAMEPFPGHFIHARIYANLMNGPGPPPVQSGQAEEG
jgi:hypothetical protein